MDRGRLIAIITIILLLIFNIVYFHLLHEKYIQLKERQKHLTEIVCKAFFKQWKLEEKEKNNTAEQKPENSRK